MRYKWKIIRSLCKKSFGRRWKRIGRIKKEITLKEKNRKTTICSKKDKTTITTTSKKSRGRVIRITSIS
jgi:hypothetical protein